jgi:hypothetical protein
MAIDLFEYSKQGKVFHAANTANATLSALSTTATGFILHNPTGSGVNVAILNVSGTFNTAQAGASSIGIAMAPAPVVADITHTTPLVVRSAILTGGDGGARAKADTSATTVGTPVFVKHLASVNATSSVVFTRFSEDINGSLILPEGVSIQLAYVTTAAVGLFSMTWLEYKP